MQGNRRRDTSPELRVRKLLHAAGLRYRVDWPLPFDRRRRADIVFPKQRLVVFIDGCFWHGCPEHYVAPRSNAEFWAAKIEGNILRDRDTDLRLEKAGWAVVRIWEHSDSRAAADVVTQALRTKAPAAPCCPPLWMIMLASWAVMTVSG